MGRKTRMDAVALFRPYEQKAKPVEPEAAPVAERPSTAKNRPTPTRKEAEAARMAAVHPKLTPRQTRAADSAADRERQAQALERQDNAPQRVLMRNYVDSHWSLLELMLPLLAILVLAMMVSSVPALSQLLFAVTVMLYVFVAAGLVNFLIVWRRFKALLLDRQPDANTKGLAFAMLSRMMSLRRMRQPKAVVKRGDPI